MPPVLTDRDSVVQVITNLLSNAIKLGLLTFMLEKEGYTILSAADGEEALKKAREERPDLIFLDIMMPKKNGYEVCQKLKGDPQAKDIHIILLTAKGQKMNKKRGMEPGGDDYITKPCAGTRGAAAYLEDSGRTYETESSACWGATFDAGCTS